MKKFLSIVVTLCMLGCAVGFWMVGGSRFLVLQSGPEVLGDGALSQAEGKYISYEAAYPVASSVEEYYSGDPDRARTMGFVVYDEQRQAFLYVVVPDQNSGRLENLMWNLKLAVELRAGKDMSPATVEGTLEPMEDSAVKRVLAAVDDSEIIGLYHDFQGEAAYQEAYFGDEYGKVMEDMCLNLDQIVQQTEWYYVEDGVIDGLEKSDVWICILAAGLSLLIFVIRLISLFTGGKKKNIALPAPAGSKMEQFYARQREWVEEWCEYNLNRGRRLAYLSVIGGVVILVGIGILVKVPTQRLIAFYLSLGLLLGEIIGAMFWYGQKGQSKPEKILKKFAKRIGKILPSAAEQEMFAEDILAAGKEWEFREKTKEGMQQGVVGGRYWVTMQWNGMVTIVDADKLGKIETETISGSVRSGKVRVGYQFHAVRFYYKSAAPKKSCDAAISFDSKENQRNFIALARKRVGENVEFIMLAG